MTEAKHSKWSASGFEQRMLCPGSHVLQAGAPRRSSIYSAEGTAAHMVLTWALQQGKNAADFIGTEIEADGFEFTVDDDMAAAVQVCVDYVRDVADGGVTLVDQRVNYARWLQTPTDEAWGTADVIVLRPDGELVVIDYKHGRGVEVDAKGNPQMSLYALGALQALEDLGMADDVTGVRLVISQPRVKTAASEHRMELAELKAWADTARSAVATCENADKSVGVDTNDWNELFLRPGEKQCRFCSAKATCPALRDEVHDTISGGAPASPEEFIDTVPQPKEHSNNAAWLAACLSKVDLIEDWCKAIRAEAERRLLAGEAVPGYKLVQGKKGNRAWADAKAAEELLTKTFRLKVEEAYDLKLISPTSAEKLHKAGVIGPRQWTKAQGLIVQPEGKPHVAPESDNRPAIEIRPVVEDFDNLADSSDLA